MNVTRCWLATSSRYSTDRSDAKVLLTEYDRDDYAVSGWTVEGPFMLVGQLQGAVEVCREAAELLRRLIGADAETLRLFFTEGNDADSLIADLDAAGEQ